MLPDLVWNISSLVAPAAQQITNPEVPYNVKVESITYEWLHVTDNYGRKNVIPQDTLIISQLYGERKANNSLYTELDSKVSEIYRIGDCLLVREIEEAVWTESEVARKIQ